MMDFVDYRAILRRELESRCGANPRYSLRAFSRDLGISSSRLSQILRKRQGLSETSARKIAARLHLDENETQAFITSVEASDSRSRKRRLQAQHQLAVFTDTSDPSRRLQLDAFHVISDWYHYAILELATLPSFKSDIAWIAKRLGISSHEARSAIERLIRLELLEKQKGHYVPTQAHLAVGNGMPSEAIRKFNQQILAKAAQAVTLQSVDERDISTLTVAIDSSRVPEFKEIIKGFRRRFNQSAMEMAREPKREPNEVYSLAVQFFRLTVQEKQS